MVAAIGTALTLVAIAAALIIAAIYPALNGHVIVVVTEWASAQLLGPLLSPSLFLTEFACRAIATVGSFGNNPTVATGTVTVILPEAFIGLLQGRNFGKLVIQLTDV